MTRRPLDISGIILTKKEKELIQNNMRYVIEFVHRVYGKLNEDTREDMIQDALLNVCMRIRNFNKEDSYFIKFMKNITVYSSLNYYFRIVKPYSKYISMIDENNNNIIDYNYSYCENYWCASYSDKLYNAINDLSSTKKQFIKKVFFDEENPRTVQFDINKKLSEIKESYSEDIDYSTITNDEIKREFYYNVCKIKDDIFQKELKNKRDVIAAKTESFKKFIDNKENILKTVYKNMRIKSGFYYKELILQELFSKLSKKEV